MRGISSPTPPPPFQKPTYGPWSGPVLFPSKKVHFSPLKWLKMCLFRAEIVHIYANSSGVSVARGQLSGTARLRAEGWRFFCPPGRKNTTPRLDRWPTDYAFTPGGAIVGPSCPAASGMSLGIEPLFKGGRRGARRSGGQRPTPADQGFLYVLS